MSYWISRSRYEPASVSVVHVVLQEEQAAEIDDADHQQDQKRREERQFHRGHAAFVPVQRFVASDPAHVPNKAPEN